MKHQEYKPLFVATQNPGVTNYRLAMFAKRMNGDLFPDKSLELLADWESVLDRTTEVLYDLEKQVVKCNSIIWSRLSTKRGLATLLGFKHKYSTKKNFAEIDDAVFHVDSSNPGHGHIAPDKDAYSVFLRQIEFCDALIVSTEFLKKYYKSYTKKPIYVVKNAVDINMWNKLYGKRKENKKTKIMWQGGIHHGLDLQVLMPVIPKILKEFKDVEFHFVGCLPDNLKMDGCIYHEPVIIKKYPEKVAEINPDIIIAPLSDTILNRGRSNLRVIEAGAYRAPVVASGNKNLPYYEILTKSKGGFLANNEKDWYKGLHSLISDNKLRKQMGQSLYKEVLNNYNIKDVAREYLKILKGE
jgi:glycosyltransferase involved in cell wall biosynthesis